MFRRSFASFTGVVFEAVGQTGHLVTLSREKSLNALNIPMVNALREYYTELHKAPADSLVVVMTGAGSKAFCAGGDVVSIVKDTPKGCRQRFFYEEYQADHLVATLNQPHIALWNGIVMGGGVGISVHGRYRVACEKSLFAMPETGIGLFPDVGGSWVLSRLPHEGLGMYLALTGARLKGSDLLHAGLATHYVAVENFDKLRQELLNASPADVKKILKAHGGDLKAFSLESNLGDIASCFGKQLESVEHIMDKLEKRDDDWGRGLAATLSKMSPSSLKVSFECQRRAASHKSIAETFAMEYNVTQRCMDTTDFNRGVTALLIDKSGEKPSWDPEALQLVTPDLVDKHFDAPSKAPIWHPTKPFDESKL